MGTTFDVVWPLAAGAGSFPIPPDPPSEDEAAQKGEEISPVHSILLIEDNPSDVKIINRALELSGIRMTVYVAFDGEQALAVLEQFEQGAEQQRPTLVLLDWNLPRISGSEVLSYIRHSERLSGVPVVVVTSTNSPSDVMEIRNLGANAHFRKPTDLDAYLDLRTIVLDLLSKPPGTPS